MLLGENNMASSSMDGGNRRTLPDQLSEKSQKSQAK